MKKMKNKYMIFALLLIPYSLLYAKENMEIYEVFIEAIYVDTDGGEKNLGWVYANHGDTEYDLYYDRYLIGIRGDSIFVDTQLCTITTDGDTLASKNEGVYYYRGSISNVDTNNVTLEFIYSEFGCIIDQSEENTYTLKNIDNTYYLDGKKLIPTPNKTIKSDKIKKPDWKTLETPENDSPFYEEIEFIPIKKK